MGKYSNTFTQKELPKKNQTHEIWKNLGCLMMILIPALSIASAVVTVDWIIAFDKYLIPSGMRGIPRPPDFFYNSNGLLTIFKLVTGFENFYAIAVVSLIFMLLLSGLISMVYAVVYSRVAPSRYGPLDAPPQKIRVKKKSR
jgi:hypothetical protein